MITIFFRWELHFAIFTVHHIHRIASSLASASATWRTLTSRLNYTMMADGIHYSHDHRPT